MNGLPGSRREFLKLAGAVAGAGVLKPGLILGQPELQSVEARLAAESQADYALRITASPIEIAPKRIVSGDHLQRSSFQAPCCDSKRVSR